MSEDEWFVLFFCIAGLSIWIPHTIGVASKLSHVASCRGPVTTVFLGGGAAAVFLFWLLGNWAAHDVVDSMIYRVFYFVLGVGWMVVSLVFFGWLGLSLRDDVMERRNPAAAFAIAGAVCGSGVIYAMANTGDGPGWWCVIVAAILSQAACFIGWVVLMQVTRLHARITVDRDLGAGFRAGFWLLGSGILLGRAAAGTWTSIEATWHEFLDVAVMFPALIFAAVALELLIARPSTRSDISLHKPKGLAFGTLYLAFAIWLTHQAGPWT
jgi:uncharacterized membrane protein YjfL (UPF0719 family)